MAEPLTLAQAARRIIAERDHFAEHGEYIDGWHSAPGGHAAGSFAAWAADLLEGALKDAPNLPAVIAAALVDDPAGGLDAMADGLAGFVRTIAGNDAGYASAQVAALDTAADALRDLANLYR